MSKSEFSEEADNVPEFGTNNLILHELFHHKYLSLIPTTDMSEYLSIPTALEIVKKEIHLSGGRISRTDLQILCNIEMASVDQLIRELLTEDKSQYQLIGGDVVHKVYYTQLAKEINLIVKWEGGVSFATLSSKLQLPMELITEIVQTYHGKLIHGILKNIAIFSEHHIQKQYAQLHGLCLGTKTSLQLSYLATQVTGLDEGGIFKYISELIELGELKGTCSAKEYVPESFQRYQRDTVDAYFRNFGIVELSRLTGVYGVSGKLIDFIRVTFPDAVQLLTSIVSSEILKPVERAMEEIVVATPQENCSNNDEVDWNGSGGIPWLHVPSVIPAGLPASDEEPLLNYLFHNAISRSELVDVPTSDGLYLVNKRFFSWIQKNIDLDCQRVGSTLLTTFKSQIEKSVSISSTSHTGLPTVRHDAEKDVTAGKGRGKKGDKGKVVEEVDAPGRKTETKKKAQKVNQMTEQASQQPSIMNYLAVYIENDRMISLIKEWCQPISDFSEGIVHSDSDSIDNRDEESHYLDPLYAGLWDILRDSSIEKYKAFANRAKDEAAQGGASDHLKKEQERDKKFEGMWNELQVVAKGMLALENKQAHSADVISQTSPVHRYLLMTRCAKIAELLTVHACWECGVEFKCSNNFPLDTEYKETDETTDCGNNDPDADHQSTTSTRGGQSQASGLSKVSGVSRMSMPSITSGDRQLLQRTLPKETSATLLKLWGFVMSERHTFWDFFEYLESCISCGNLNLVGHKIDKKKERAVSFSMKQAVMDRLRITPTIEESLPLLASLALHQGSGTIIEFPHLHQSIELFDYLMDWFGRKNVFNQEEIARLRLLMSVAATDDMNGELLEEVKSLLLTKK